MNEILWGVRWPDMGEGLGYKHTVFPVVVIRDGILPGCGAPTITVVYPDGSKANSSRDMYHASEREAWEVTMKEMQEGARDLEESIAETKKEIEDYSNEAARIKVILESMDSSK